ncbi:MAG: hypothetical protein ACLFT3_13335 [Cyclobacteriaceae bacterium]
MSPMMMDEMGGLNALSSSRRYTRLSHSQNTESWRPASRRPLPGDRSPGENDDLLNSNIL